MPEMQTNKSLDESTRVASAEPPPKSSFHFWAFIAFAAVVVLAYAAPLIDLLQFAAVQSSYNFVILVPVISAYLIFEKRSELTGPFKTSFAPAIFFAVLGILATIYFYFGAGIRAMSDYHAITAVAVLSFLFAGAFFCFGSSFLWQIAFPLAFLFFAIPLPADVMHWIQVKLQHASAEAANWMMPIANVPFLRAENGLDFKLPGIPIRVAEECSGFNSSYVLFMVSFLAGYLLLKSPWKRLILVCFVIPLAILRNGFRITTIAYLCTYHGTEMIDHPIHHRGGPVFFALSLIPFLALVWFLRRSERKTGSQS